MGLAAAYYALQRGHQVHIYEAEDRPGGMAAHFDFGGLSIERFYHFVCKSDDPTFDLMRELGIADRLRWRATSMGYLIEGRLFAWDNPLSVLRFPLLTPMEKLRYGWQMFSTIRTARLERLEGVSASDWIIRGAGPSVFDLLWRRLLALKFHERADSISARWMAGRIRRIGRSRRSLMQEELGYIEGGSETLVAALVKAIEKAGGQMACGTPVEEVVVAEGRVRAVRVGGQDLAVDAVISTVPTPYVANLVPGLSESAKATYRAIHNNGVICVALKLRRSVTPHFWLNINDDSSDISGVIEFSNLRPLPDTVVFIPYYLPRGHGKWDWSNARLVAEGMSCLRKLNPALADDDLIDSHVGRLRYAQPIYDPDFQAKLPPVQTEISGLQIADTAFYYPEDRSLAESIRLARRMAYSVA